TCTLISCIIISMASYSFVIAKQSKMSAIQQKTAEINYENAELQNKVDFLKSFYNINKQVSKIKKLQKAEKIIEVKTILPNTQIAENQSAFSINPLRGF
ncbi:MAG: hypothetical protein PHV68_10285, partial [Candidatus Gastranaerophilales bacterium]|nr:hypothetical protein [Candidatus Gastranaerophilales bacterium]